MTMISIVLGKFAPWLDDLSIYFESIHQFIFIKVFSFI